MFCQECGNKVNTEQLFCPVCGLKNKAIDVKNEQVVADHTVADDVDAAHILQAGPPVQAMPPPLPEIHSPVQAAPELKPLVQPTPAKASPIQTPAEQSSQETVPPQQPPPLQKTKNTVTQISANPTLKKINTKLLISLYLISVLGTLGAFVSGQLTEIFDPSGELFALEAMLFTIIYFLFYVATIVIFCISLYRAWEVLQTTTARTSSGLAVGLLFVPVFNVYWVFQSLWGWSKDYQLFTTYQEKGTMPYVNKQIFLAQCMLLPMLAIPIVNNVIAYFIVPTTLIVIFQVSKATNFIIDNNLLNSTEVNT